MIIGRIGVRDKDGRFAQGGELGHRGCTGPGDHQIRSGIGRGHILDKRENPRLSLPSPVPLLGLRTVSFSCGVEKLQPSSKRPEIGEGFSHGEIDPMGPLTATKDEDGRLEGIQGKGLQSLPPFSFHDLPTDRISRHHHSPPEKVLSLLKAHRHHIGHPSQHPIGQARIEVLLMDEEGDATQHRCHGDRSRSIPADPHHHLGPMPVE
jgi:hypothetical protein